MKISYIISAAIIFPRRNVQAPFDLNVLRCFFPDFHPSPRRCSIHVLTHSASTVVCCIQLDVVGVCALRSCDNNTLGGFYVNAYAKVVLWTEFVAFFLTGILECATAVVFFSLCRNRFTWFIFSLAWAAHRRTASLLFAFNDFFRFFYVTLLLCSFENEDSWHDTFNGISEKRTFPILFFPHISNSPNIFFRHCSTRSVTNWVVM